MRAKEFTTEAVDLVSPPAQWSSSPQFTTAKWTDKTGARVQTDFIKTAPGVVELSFSRSDKNGAHTMGRTDTARTGGSAIFGQVAATLKDYLAKNPDVTHVTYRAVDDPARSKLYARLAKMSGALGLEQVTKTSDLPAHIQQQQKAAQVDKLSRNTIDKIPSGVGKNTNTLPPPPASVQIGAAKPTDQFVLKRQADAQLKVAQVPRRISGNEYTNVYGGGKEPTAFQNQQYIKDLQAQLQRFPNDVNLQAELDSFMKKGPQS